MRGERGLTPVSAWVTGEHDDLLRTRSVQSGAHLRDAGAETVGDRDHADHAAVERDHHGGAAEPRDPVDSVAAAATVRMARFPRARCLARRLSRVVGLLVGQ